jgi:hypothetical protein
MPALLMTNPPARSGKAKSTKPAKKLAPAKRSAAKRTNPPGLALAVIGNPPTSSVPRKGTTMTAKNRTRPKAKRRTNPSSLYWRVGAKTPWRTGPEAIIARDRAALQSQRHPGVVLPSVRKRVAARDQAAQKKTKRAAPKRAVSVPLKFAVAASKPAASKKRARRNPPGVAAGAGRGLIADFKGLGAALADLGKHPTGFLYLGGGALGAALAGGVLNVQLGRVMPPMQPGMARLVNFASYAGTALLLSRMPKDAKTRQQMLAGGLAVALIELAKPGTTAPVIAKIPGVDKLVAPATAEVALRTPAVQAQPEVAAAVASAAQPWYRAGGKANPVNWLSGVAEGEPIAVDGIADDDGSIQGLSDDDAMNDGDPGEMPMADGDMPNDSIAGPGIGTDADQPLVMTYLNGLGCPLTGRPTGLNALVQP